MQRKIGRTLAAIGCLALVCLFASVARSEDERSPAGQPSPEAMQKMMEMMMKASAPGPEHAKLAEMSGTWDADVTYYSPMGPQKSKGVMQCEMILGGRVLQMKYDGTMAMGGQTTPFHGIGLNGYDNTEKKYWNFWIDDMSTGCLITKGTCDGDVMTTEGEMVDPGTGKPAKVKQVATKVDKDHEKFEMFCPGPDGKEMKVMEIMYTRKM